MIQGIGIDAVAIKRFKEWQYRSQKSLKRILTEAEIQYCLSVAVKSAERFAARYAAKEAFLKAVSAAYPEFTYSLLSVCRCVEIRNATSGAPYMVVNWHKLLKNAIQQKSYVHLSMSHTEDSAFVVVIIESVT